MSFLDINLVMIELRKNINWKKKYIKFDNDSIFWYDVNNTIKPEIQIKFSEIDLRFKNEKSLEKYLILIKKSNESSYEIKIKNNEFFFYNFINFYKLNKRITHDEYIIKDSNKEFLFEQNWINDKIKEINKKKIFFKCQNYSNFYFINYNINVNFLIKKLLGFMFNSQINIVLIILLMTFICFSIYLNKMNYVIVFIFYMLFFFFVYLMTGKYFYLKYVGSKKIQLSMLQDNDKTLPNKNWMIICFEYLFKSKVRKKITPKNLKFEYDNSNIKIKYLDGKSEINKIVEKYNKNGILIVEYNEPTKSIVSFFKLKFNDNYLKFDFYCSSYFDLNYYLELFYIYYIKYIIGYKINKIINDKNFNSTILSKSENNNKNKEKEINFDKELEMCKKRLDEDFILLDHTKNNWELEKTIDSFKMFLKKDPLYIVRLSIIKMDFSYEKVVKCIKDDKLFMTVVKTIKDTSIIKKVNSILSIKRLVFRGKFPVKDRDFITYNYEIETDTEFKRIMLKAPSEYYPENKNAVRGDVKVIYNYVQKIDENSCYYKVYGIVDAKIKMVPQSILKILTRENSKTPYLLNEYMKKKFK